MTALVLGTLMIACRFMPVALKPPPPTLSLTPAVVSAAERAPSADEPRAMASIPESEGFAAGPADDEKAPDQVLPPDGDSPATSSSQTAEPGGEQTASAPSDTQPQPGTSKSTVAPRPVEDMLCSVQVVQEDPAKVLELISRQTKTNLVLLSSPTAKLTINLVNVRLIDMIRHICALTQLGHVKVGSTFILAGESQLKAAYPLEWNAANPTTPVAQAPPAITKVYRANYVSSIQIAEALGKLFDKTKLSAVAGPVQANPTVLSADTASTTGMSSTTNSTNSTNTAPGSGTQSPSNGASDQQGSAVPAKLLILRGDAATVEEAYQLAIQMDTARPQVSIEVTVYDIEDSALKQLGLSWTIGNVDITENSTNSPTIGSFTRAPQTFSAVVSALEQKDKAKLLASPKISVLDGERAYILIGDRINYPVLTGYSQANTPIFSTAVERVGIYLQVAASISSDQTITLCMYPQVSSITGYLNVNGASYPQVSTREAQTTLRLRSGETVVLGGLLQNEETSELQKLPILSELPFIGELFKRRQKTKTASQVIISIKPTLINIDEHR